MKCRFLRIYEFYLCNGEQIFKIFDICGCHYSNISFLCMCVLYILISHNVNRTQKHFQVQNFKSLCVVAIRLESFVKLLTILYRLYFIIHTGSCIYTSALIMKYPIYRLFTEIISNKKLECQHCFLPH